MKEERLVLFTFDYELFLGEKSGSVQKCLIEPTDRLIGLLSKYKFKGIFFVDTMYLMRLEELADTNKEAIRDQQEIIAQLTRLVNDGHEIHPHIHPHWKDAVYLTEINEWQLSKKRYYSFSSLDINERMELFSRSLNVIRSIVESAGSNQSIDSYRAGGWSIQPFEVIQPLFKQYGIENEWSVIPGKYHISDAHSFDFRNAPVQKPVYRFTEDPCQELKSGLFKEWTISSITLKRIEKWIDFKISGILQRLGKFPRPKGKTVSSVIEDEGDIYTSPGDKRIVASLEGLNPFTLRKYLNAVAKSDYYQFISHPKLISTYEFSMTDKLFRKLTKRYTVQTDFRKFKPA